MNGIEKRLYVQLKKIYPDGKVSGLQHIDPSLYNEVRRFATEINMKPRDVIETLGFLFVRKKKRTEDDEAIIARLKQELLLLYPDSIVQGLTQKNQTLYNQLRNYSTSQDTSIEDFLKKNGFKYVNQSTKRKYPIDQACIKKLHHEYQCSTTSEFADLCGVKKQYISKLATCTPKRKRKKVWDDTITETEKQEILVMIQSREFTYQDDQTLIRIYKHVTDIKEFAIFYKKNDNLKCLFSLPSDILSEMNAYRFHELDERDFHIIKAIEKRGFLKGDVVRLDSDDEELKNLLARRLVKSDWDSRKEYVKFLGWTYVDGRTLTLEDLRERVLPYIDQDGYFRMTTEDEGYFTLKNTFGRKGFRSTKEWIEALGFKYERTRNMHTTEEKYKQRLKSYVVFDDKVYIHSVTNQRFYHLLMFYSQRKGMTFNELLKYLGYKRLYKEELPEGFTPYVWQPYSSSVMMIEDFQDLLDDLIIDETTKELLLQPEDQLYLDLVAFAKTQSKTIFELLEEWGYTITEQKLFFTSTLTYEQKSQLERLKSAQGDLETSPTLKEKIKRSQRLVREIKILYNYRCQLCAHDVSGETIPYIIKSDGTHYVEVHHIIQLSEADLITTDIELDSFENVICVCSHHHRVLHFHNGGYNQLILGEDGKLYFTSNYGDKLRVHHNLHIQIENVGVT